jgi:hypothetical protein
MVLVPCVPPRKISLLPLAMTSLRQLLLAQLTCQPDGSHNCKLCTQPFGNKSDSAAWKKHFALMHQKQLKEMMGEDVTEIDCTTLPDAAPASATASSSSGAPAQKGRIQKKKKKKMQSKMQSLMKSQRWNQIQSRWRSRKKKNQQLPPRQPQLHPAVVLVVSHLSFSLMFILFSHGSSLIRTSVLRRKSSMVIVAAHCNDTLHPSFATHLPLRNLNANSVCNCLKSWNHRTIVLSMVPPRWFQNHGSSAAHWNQHH